MSLKLRPGPEAMFFREEDEDVWGPQLYEDGLLRLPLKTIAWGVGCSMNLLAAHPRAAFYVRQGWADHDRLVEQALMAQMTDDPMSYEEAERAQIRALRADAIKTRLKVAMDKDRHIEAMEANKALTSSIEKLSDAELEAKLKEAVKNL